MKFTLSLYDRLIDDPRVTYSETREEQKTPYFPLTADEFLNSSLSSHNIAKLNDRQKDRFLSSWLNRRYGDLDACVKDSVTIDSGIVYCYIENVRIDYEQRCAYYTEVTKHYTVELETAQEAINFIWKWGLHVNGPASLTDYDD